VCQPKDCGLVDNGCEGVPDCGNCGQQSAAGMGGEFGGPMTCGASHLCECPPEGNTAAAVVKCNGASGDALVAEWCAAHGGCDTALCGAPPVPKVPVDVCKYGGTIKPTPDTYLDIWCCITPP
jgi:hypothetical protein